VNARAQVVAQTDAGLVVGLQWRRRDRRDTSELFQVLRLRDGKIVDMQDCRDRLEALKVIGAAA
jgi:hypothetical protein